MSASRAALPITLLAAAGFLSSAGSRVVDPVLHPIATEFGVGVPDLWILISAFTLPYGLAQLVLGPIGDRVGKLRVLLAAIGGYAVFTAACALCTTLPALVLLRACAGAASAGLIPVCVAYISDAVPYDQRQVVLGRFLSGVVVAQVVSGPLGGVFGQYLGWRGVFWVLSGLALAVGFALVVRLRGLTDRRSAGRVFNPENYVRMLTHRTGRWILLAGVLDGALIVGCFPFLAPYLHEHFGLSYAQAGLVLACFGFGALTYTRLARWLLRRLGEGGMVLAGGIGIAGALAVGSWTSSWPVFVGVEWLLGLSFFLVHGVLQARSTEMLPQARTTAVAAFACLLFLGQSAGALLISAAIARWDYKVAFLLDATAVLAFTLWLSRFLRRVEPAGAQPIS